jgi:hypothetical protein
MADITKINLNGTNYNLVDSAATSAIASEVSRAQGAESAITSALSAEVVARQSADTQIQTALSGKADASTTLSGYGITDAYTKTEVDTALAGKANTATTYTKSEVDTALAGKQNTLSAGTGIQISGDVISCTVDTGLYVVVTTLPAQPAAGNENKIHLVPLASGETQNMYAEYIWKGDAWEKLGEKQIDTDLTDYWTSAQTQSAITAATSGLASTGYVDSAITDALGAGVVEEGSVEGIFASAGIVGYETDDETGNEVMVVNPMATESWIEDFVGGSLIEALNPGTAEENTNTIEDIFIQSNIATIEYDDELERDVVIVNPMATEGYVDNALSGITASYSAATETLILNIPSA